MDEIKNDIEPTKDMIEELLSYKERLKIALKASKICVFEVDLTKQLYTFFENAEDIFGVSGANILRDVQPYSKLQPDEYQKAVSEYFSHPDDTDVVNYAFESIFAGKTVTYEARMKAGDTKFKWCKLDVTPLMSNGVPIKMIGVITDINGIKQQTEALKKEATLDIYTGLYNKKNAEYKIKLIMEQYPRKKHALILFDLDNFKQINDTYGHAQGDAVIKSVAENLKITFRKDDVVGRFGGDEFIIFVRDIINLDMLIEKLNVLLKNDDNVYKVTKSIGVSIFPNHGTDFIDLFNKADKALYKSKHEKNTYTIFNN